MAEHGRCGLRFAGNSERHVAFGKPHQRFLDVARLLILRHHRLEAVNRADEVVFLHVEAADRHFLAGEIVARDLDLLLRAFGIFGIGEFPDDFLQRIDRLARPRLIAAHVRNLVEIG
jgi:hypothetical protein